MPACQWDNDRSGIRTGAAETRTKPANTILMGADPDLTGSKGRGWFHSGGSMFRMEDTLENVCACVYTWVCVASEGIVHLFFISIWSQEARATGPFKPTAGPTHGPGPTPGPGPGPTPTLTLHPPLDPCLDPSQDPTLASTPGPTPGPGTGPTLHLPWTHPCTHLGTYPGTHPTIHPWFHP